MPLQSSEGLPGAPERGRPGGRDLLLVFALALAARLAGVAFGLLTNRDQLFTADAASSYFPIARSLAAGAGYQLDGSFLEASRIAPLYPLWVAFLLRAAGPGLPLWLLGLFNALFRAGAAVLVYLLARRTFGPRAAWGALGLFLLDPWEAFWVGYVMKEPLAVPLFLLAVWLVARAADRHTPRLAALAGVGLGLATLARFASGAFWPAALFVLAHSAWRAPRPPRDRLRLAGGLAAALTLGMGLVMAPWLLRNWRVIGQPVVSTEFAGRYLYASNGPGRVAETGGYEESTGLDRGPLPVSAAEKRAALQSEGRLAGLATRHLLAQPQEAARRIAARAVNMWRPTYAAASRRNRLLLGLPYLVMLGLSLGGAALAARQRLPCAGLAAPLLTFALLHLVFWAEIRNRQYLTPLLVPFAGLALARLTARSVPLRLRFLRSALGRALLWTAAAYFLLLPLLWPRAQYGGGHYRIVDLALGLPLLAAALVAAVSTRHRAAGLRLAALFLAAGTTALAADGYYLFGFVHVLQPHWWHDRSWVSLVTTRADPEVGFVKRPNRRWEFGGVTYSIDARGFRNPPGVREAPLVFVGDSFTEGHGVDARHAFPTLVGQQLGCAAANLGIGGHGPLQELITLRHYAVGYRPRWVVWQFYAGNDLADAEVFAEWQRTRPSGRPVPVKVRIVSHSLLIGLVTPDKWFRPPVAWLRYPGGQRVPVHRLQHYDPGEALERAEGARLLAEALAEGARFCRERGVRLLAVSVPQMAEVEAPRLDALPGDPQLQVPPAPPGHDFAAVVRRACREADVPLVDTTAALKAAAAIDNRDLYLVDDQHLGRRGNEVVAGQVAAWLRVHHTFLREGPRSTARQDSAARSAQ